jgi:hypothetical protein
MPCVAVRRLPVPGPVAARALLDPEAALDRPEEPAAV